MIWKTSIKVQVFSNLPAYLNQKTILMRLWFFTFLKVCTEMIKNIKYLKNNRSDYIAILPGYEIVWHWFPFFAAVLEAN